MTSDRIRNIPLLELARIIGRTFVGIAEIIGGMTLLQFRVLRAMLTLDIDYDETLRQFYKVGVKSLAVVVFTAILSGAIMVLQGEHYVRSTGATSLVGWAAGTGVLAEIGPLLIGLMFSGRVGANNTAELGSMVVTEQISALRALAIDPVKYLVVPRFLTMIVMLVLLTGLGDLFALMGGALTSHLLLQIDFRLFWQSVLDSHLLSEFYMGLCKGFAFGGAIAITSCYFGLNTKGGARGVGRAVNDSVVTSAIAIFAVNILVVVLWY